MPNPPKSTFTFALDIEFSGLRAEMGTREQMGLAGHRRAMQPPRITQFALARFEHINDKVLGKELLIGSGPDRGYTSILQEYIQKYNVVNADKIPPEFFQELVNSGKYDRLTLVEDSILNDQVRSHVKHLLQSGGQFQTAEQHIRSFMHHVDDALTKVDSVNVLAYNKGLDIDMMVRELGAEDVDPNLQRTFTEWYESLTSSGKLVLQAGERPVHLAMFERMLSDKDYVPEFTKGHAFDAAKAAGTAVEDIGTETLQKHHALRSYVDDISKLAQGGSIDDVYRGLSPELQDLFKGLKGKQGEELFAEFERIGDALDASQSLKTELRNHYRELIRAIHGEDVAAHMIDFNKFNFTKGWKQEMVAGEGMGMNVQSAHDAVDDIETTWELNRKLGLDQSAKQTRETLAETMASEQYRKKGQQLAYKSWLADSPGFTGATGDVADKLANQFTRGTSWMARAAGKMGKSKGKVALAVAGAVTLVAGYKLGRSLKVQHARDQYTAPFEEKLEGLRNPYSKYLIDHGIRPNEYPHGNVSDFGSGRKNYQDPDLGFSMHPDIGAARSIFAQGDVQRRMAWAEANQRRQLIPNSFKNSDYRNDQLIDTSEWLMDMVDGNTVRMRRAWMDRDIPLLGNAFHAVQRIGLGLLEGVVGKDAMEQIAPSVEVSLAGVNAPDVNSGPYSIPYPESGAATDISERLLDSADKLNISGPRDNFGRYVGTFSTKNNRDINRSMVLWGGAMSAGPQYMAAQNTAMASNAGVFESPFYHGVASAQEKGVSVRFHQASSFKDLSVGNDAGQMYSAGAWFMQRNNQMSGITDQMTRNQHVFPFSRTEASLPYNMGSLYS